METEPYKLYHKYNVNTIFVGDGFYPVPKNHFAAASCFYCFSRINFKILCAWANSFSNSPFLTCESVLICILT